MEKNIKTQAQVNSWIMSVDWAGKEGTQVVELAVKDGMESCRFSGTYPYKTHIDIYGGEVPAQTSFYLQPHPERVVLGDPIAPKDKPQPQVFNRVIRRGEPHKFLVDFNTDEGKLMYFFLSRHPLVEVEGEKNPNLQQHLFTLTVRSKRAQKNYEKLTANLQIANLIMIMNFEDVKNLIYFIKKTPFSSPGIHMTQTEMKVYLVGEHMDGAIWGYEKEFYKYYEATSNDERSTKVTIEKAKINKFITYSGGLYSNEGGQPLASDDNGLLAHYMSHPSELNILKDNIAKIESKLVIDDLKDEEAIKRRIDNPNPPVKKGPFGRPAKVQA